MKTIIILFIIITILTLIAWVVYSIHDTNILFPILGNILQVILYFSMRIEFKLRENNKY